MLKALKAIRALKIRVKEVNFTLKAFFTINNKDIINNKLNN
jgi:hypothetical protein